MGLGTGWNPPRKPFGRPGRLFVVPWKSRHGAILAATVMKTGGVLYTLNKKHYPMPDVVVHGAW